MPEYTRYDQHYKALWSFPVVVEHTLKGFTQEPWLEYADFGSLRLVTPEFITGGYQRRQADMVWELEVRHPDAPDTKVYVVIHLEFQSSVDEFMALRMSEYRNLILRQMKEQQKLKPPLPLVFPMVIYFFPEDWDAEFGVAGLMRWDHGPLSSKIHSKLHASINYGLLDFYRQLGRARQQRNNLVAVFIECVCACSGPIEKYAQIGRKLQRILKALGNKALFAGVERWYIWNLRTAIPAKWEPYIKEVKTMDSTIEVFENFRNRMVQQGREEGLELGREQGLEQGREEGLELGREQGIMEGQANTAKILLSMAQIKFGAQDLQQFETELRDVSKPEILNQISDWLVHYGSLEQVIERLQQAMKK